MTWIKLRVDGEHCVPTATDAESVPYSSVKRLAQSGCAQTHPSLLQLRSSLSAANTVFHQQARILCYHSKLRPNRRPDPPRLSRKWHGRTIRCHRHVRPVAATQKVLGAATRLPQASHRSQHTQNRFANSTQACIVVVNQLRW